jgi:hypothetical protein
MRAADNVPSGRVDEPNGACNGWGGKPVRCFQRQWRRCICNFQRGLCYLQRHFGFPRGTVSNRSYNRVVRGCQLCIQYGQWFRYGEEGNVDDYRVKPEHDLWKRCSCLDLYRHCFGEWRLAADSDHWSTANHSRGNRNFSGRELPDYSCNRLAGGTGLHLCLCFRMDEGE